MVKSLICKNENPIIVIDDDEDDISIIMESIFSLGINNEIVTFNEARLALNYFAEDHPSPFFILCDINMPVMDGLKFREKIQEDYVLTLKATPFIFLANTLGTVDLDLSVNRLTILNSQGFFNKPKSYGGFVELFRSIITYWDESALPMFSTKNTIASEP